MKMKIKANVLATNSFLAAGTIQKDSFLLASFLKRIPWGSSVSGVARLCQASASAPKVSSKEEASNDNMPSLPVQPLEQMMTVGVITTTTTLVITPHQKKGTTHLKPYQLTMLAAVWSVKHLVWLQRSVKPFVDPVELERTRKLIKNFCENENLGKKLQDLLCERAQSMENWLADWWLATAYLEYRNPVIVYSSPGLVWPQQRFKSQNEQLLYAAHVINYALEFNKKVEEKKIPQEKLGGKHLLCMSQYSRIFGTCRVPKLPADELVFQEPQNPSRNIIVMYNNHLFSLPAFEENTRRPLSAAHFYAMLADLVKQGDEFPGVPLGVLTTEHRDTWAKVYEKIKTDERNKRLLEEHVERALFVVCVDKPLALGGGLDYGTRCSKLLLHGFGHRGNAANRWYDKTVQFVVGAFDDGVGIAYEHSPAEGGPIGVLSDFILEKTKAATSLENLPDHPVPRRLEFVVTAAVEKSIEAAGKAVDKISDELDVYGWSFSHFGKGEIKKLKVSPDSFIQIGIQVAFYKLHNHPAAQYESGSLRKYVRGRTDVIRSCSEEAVDFCRAMTRPGASADEKEKALRLALASHKKYAEDVVEGRGVDRHLLALKILARANDLEDPQIFSDVAYRRSTYFRLSTSNVPMKLDGFMVYGPLVDDGYACCYNPRENNINFGTSAWSSCRQTFLKRFKEALEETLLEMKDCLSSTPFKSKL